MTNNDGPYDETDEIYDVHAIQAQYLADLKQQLAQTDPGQLRKQRDTFLVALVRARMAQKLSQSQLAERLDMQQSAISRIETGRGNPSLNTLLAIASALHVNLVLE